MVSQIPQLLVDELIVRNVLTKDLVRQLAVESTRDGKDFGQLVVERGIIGDSELLKIKSFIYKLPTVAAVDVEINHELSEKVSDATVQMYKILPIEREGGVLKVVLLNPENVDA